jgi:hypothetical protein
MTTKGPGKKLTEEESGALEAFRKGLKSSLADRLVPVCLYGSATRNDFRPDKSNVNVLVVLKSIDMDVLGAVPNLAEEGRKFGVAPFLLTENDLKSSLDVFPVKFLPIMASYMLLEGKDVLRELDIRKEHMRHHCELETRNLLLHLRRYYLMRGGRGLTSMMAKSIVAFIENLRMAVWAKTGAMPEGEEALKAAAKEFWIDADILSKVEALRDRETSLPTSESRPPLREIHERGGEGCGCNRQDQMRRPIINAWPSSSSSPAG